MKKKIFALLMLTILLAFSMAPAAWADTSGTTGGVKWELTDGGYLTVGNYTISASSGWATSFDKTKVKIVQIGNDVSRINYAAFWQFDNLEEIRISSSVHTIADDFALGCKNLKLISVDTANTKYRADNNVLFDKDMRTLLLYPPAREGEHYTAPTTLTSIGKKAFMNCSNLKSIKIPSNVKNIGQHAFQDCANLTNVEIANNSVTTLEANTFYGCKNLKSVNLPNSLTSIANSVFYNCPNLKAINYAGTKEQWQKIDIDSSNNTYLNKATIHCLDGDITGSNDNQGGTTEPGGNDKPNTDDKPQTIPNATITLDKTNLDMIVGEKFIPIKVTINGYDQNAYLDWEYSNPNVAVVEPHERFAFTKGQAGTSVVTVALEDYPSIKAALTINVRKVEDNNNIYNISFDANSGVLQGADVIQTTPKIEMTIPGAARNGYTLKYWEDKAGQTYAANSVYKFSADTELKAVWDRNTSGGGHSNRPSGGTTTPAKPGTPGGAGNTGNTGSNTVTATNIKNVFTDLQNNAWYSEAIAYVYNKGMMNGTQNGFEPNAATTRAMLVTMLHRLEGEPAGGSATFGDVPSGQWFSNAIAWAASQGIVNGYENGLFGANDAITREQLAAILYRYAQAKGQDVSVRGDLSGFSDSAAVSGWAQEAMQWAVGAGIINGEAQQVPSNARGDNNALKPADNATRAEVAMMIMRFIENVK